MAGAPAEEEIHEATGKCRPCQADAATTGQLAQSFEVDCMSALVSPSRKPIKSNGPGNGRSAEMGWTSGLSKRDVSHGAP
jgi:hypothetical protein